MFDILWIDEGEIEEDEEEEYEEHYSAAQLMGHTGNIIKLEHNGWHAVSFNIMIRSDDRLYLQLFWRIATFKANTISSEMSHYSKSFGDLYCS